MVGLSNGIRQLLSFIGPLIKKNEQFKKKKLLKYDIFKFMTILKLSYEKIIFTFK